MVEAVPDWLGRRVPGGKQRVAEVLCGLVVGFCVAVIG
eukprot:SAG22_NODE_16249_length_330_cov_0.445887_1_plen_37_part_01